MINSFNELQNSFDGRPDTVRTTLAIRRWPNFKTRKPGLLRDPTEHLGQLNESVAGNLTTPRFRFLKSKSTLAIQESSWQ
jgi:hypothetical protein